MKLADNASLGILETKGLVGAIAAADAMVKAASVTVFRKHYPGSARVTLMCQGELAACEAAVRAGIAEADAVGELISHTVIGRPDFGAEDLCLVCIDEAMERKRERKAEAAKRATHVNAAPVAQAVEGKVGGTSGKDEADAVSTEETSAATGTQNSTPAEPEPVKKTMHTAKSREKGEGR